MIEDSANIHDKCVFQENEKEVSGCTQTCPEGGLLCGAPGQVGKHEWDSTWITI